MSNSNETTNVLLLLILMTLVFGSGAMATGLTWLFWIGIAVAIVAILFVAAVKLISAIPIIAVEIWTGLRDLALAVWDTFFRLPAFARAFARWWLLILGSPVILPLQDWRNMQRDRSRGEAIGVIRIVVSLSFVLVMSCLMWLFVVGLSAVAAIAAGAWLLRLAKDLLSIP